MKRLALRWAFRFTALLIMLGVPFAVLGGFDRLFVGNDAVSAASSFTFSTDDIKSEFDVFINTENRSNEIIELWSSFFKGENVPVIMEDISVLVISGDAPALEYAEICRARLPENQMKIKTENALLLCSKAKYSKFDIIILSAELAKVYNAFEFTENENVILAEVKNAEG